ncbi:MAG: DUF488 family protein [Chloroflexi bacterium]|nr:DUF488 family protein [Chloroflexota bacterium]
MVSVSAVGVLLLLDFTQTDCLVVALLPWCFRVGLGANVMTSDRVDPLSESNALYTIGYAGQSIEAFIEALQGAGVTVLLDVRHFPGSRFRPEFSKSNLKRSLAERGIDYRHHRPWGIPSSVRKQHGYPNHSESLWEWYESEVIEHRIGDATLLPLAHSAVAMMCVEEDPEECHRLRLGQALREHGYNYAGDLCRG